MTAEELKRKLRNAGWTIEEGTKHSQATHPAFPGVKIPIHRHKGDIPTGTLHNILKAAGLK